MIVCMSKAWSPRMVVCLWCLSGDMHASLCWLQKVLSLLCTLPCWCGTEGWCGKMCTPCHLCWHVIFHRILSGSETTQCVPACRSLSS